MENPDLVFKNIKMYHECFCSVKLSYLRITDWHLEACRVMTTGDPEGRIFLSHLHTNKGFFFLLIIKYIILF